MPTGLPAISFGTLGPSRAPRALVPEGAIWVLWKEEDGAESRMTHPGADRGRLQQLADFLQNSARILNRRVRYTVRRR